MEDVVGHQTDWNIIEKLNHEVYEEVLDIAFSYLTETKKGEWLLLKTEEISVKGDIPIDASKSVVKSLICNAKDAIKLNQTSVELQNQLSKSGLTQEKVSSFVKKWEYHHPVICKIISQTLNINRLVDMEWKFGVTAASSESSRIGHTFLQLKMVVNKGDCLENVYMELSLPQFYAFLHEMERAKASMEYFG